MLDPTVELDILTADTQIFVNHSTTLHISDRELISIKVDVNIFILICQEPNKLYASPSFILCFRGGCAVKFENFKPNKVKTELQILFIDLF